GSKVLQQILPGTATSQLIPANSLNPAEAYDISITFFKASDADATSIPGSSGFAGYGFDTKLNVSPAPVPSLFASINGTAQNGGGSIFQYTPDGTESSFADTLDRPRGL